MAQPIHCDGDGEQHPADVLVSQLRDGQTMAWCFEHYVQAARLLVTIADGPAPDDVAAEDAAVARLEGAGVRPLDDAPETPAEAAVAYAVAPEPPVDPVTVVPRGHSASRVAHEARKRTKVAKVAPAPADEDDGALGPPETPADPVEPAAVEA